MSFLNLFVAICLAAAFFYWLNAMDCKYLAVQAGKRACNTEGVQFLDDTVVLVRLRLRRNTHGGFSFYRQYRFEFASDGGHRYRGEIYLLGGRLEQVILEPYRIP